MTFRTPSLTGSTARPTPSRASTIVSPSVRFAGSRSSNSAARDVRSTLNTLRRGGPRYPVTTGATLLVRVTSVPAVADGASAVLGRSAAEGAASARRRFRGIATVKQLSGASTLSTAIMTAPAYPATLGIGRKRSCDPVRADECVRGEPLVTAGAASGVLSGRSSRQLRSEQRVKALVAEGRIGGTGPPSAEGDRDRVVAQSLARDLRGAGACFSGVGGVDLTSRIGLGCDVVVEVEDIGEVVAALDLA
jgi:hypothetical protein